MIRLGRRQGASAVAVALGLAGVGLAGVGLVGGAAADRPPGTAVDPAAVWRKGGQPPGHRPAPGPPLPGRPVSGPPVRADGLRVDLALVLAIDCSYSVDQRDYRHQIEGLAAAFRAPRVLRAIAGGPNRAVAVAVFQWSSAASQVLTVPWRVLTGPADALALADRLAAMPRRSADGATSISAALQFGTALLLRAPVAADRLVIDLSSDGRNNEGPDVSRSRDQAIGLGATINGLPILNEHRTLDRYFEARVIGGPGAFVQPARDYADYRRAILQKLLRELRLPAVSQPRRRRVVLP